MRIKNLDLIVAVSIAAINGIWALLPYHIPLLGIFLALPLVFIIPGYTLTQALLYKHFLDASKLLVFSIALSLGLNILGGFVLNLLPMGLQAKSWAALLGLLIVAFSLLGAYQRRGVANSSVQRRRLGLSLYDGILFGLAILVIIQSLLYSVIGAAHQPHQGFTQLWLLPPTQAGRSCALHLGARSFELTSKTYRITITMNGAQKAIWSPVILAPEQEWDQLVPITVPTGGTVAIDARLYRSDEPASVYQEVNSTVSVKTGQDCPNPSNHVGAGFISALGAQRLPASIQQSLVALQKGEEIW